MTAITTAVPAPMIQGLPRSPPTPASAPPAAMNGRPQQSSDGSAQHASKSSPVTAATTGPARHSSRSLIGAHRLLQDEISPIACVAVHAQHDSSDGSVVKAFAAIRMPSAMVR